MPSQWRRPTSHALAYNLGNFMRTLAMPKTSGRAILAHNSRESGRGCADSSSF